MSLSRRYRLVLLTAVAAWIVVPARAVTPRFYPDDPIAVDPEREDASGVKPRRPIPAADALEIITGRGARPHALNVNTADEVPDSSWYTNRVGPGRSMPIDQIGRGPIPGDGPPSGPWTIAAGDSDAIRPRLTARDAGGTLYDLRFDVDSHPEMATGAEAVSTRLVYALGYHTAQNHLIRLEAEDLRIGDNAAVKDGSGRRRLMRQPDLDILLAGAAQLADGSYRVIASRLPDGVDLGPFKFSGVRRDDPNDIHPHQHRRELRGLRVVFAWLNHDDVASVETQDVLEADGDRRVVRHYLVDFGSTLGSGGARPGSARAGNEYAWVARSKLLTAMTFGFWVRPWDRVRYPDVPSIGRYEAASFDAQKWTPRYRNAAFDQLRPDDAFWAARRIVAITDEAIQAVVRTAQYSDSRAGEYLAQTIRARRDAIGRAWLNALLPLADCQLTAAGRLGCRNVAVEADLAVPADEYRIRWHRFDNAADLAEPFGEEAATSTPAFAAPPSLLEANEFVMAEIRGRHRVHAGWAVPMRVYFRRTAEGWRTIGVERM
jgi:hypothetical protein